MKHIAHRRLIAVQHSQVCIQSPDLTEFTETDIAVEENVFSMKSAFMVLFAMITHVTDVFSSAAVCYYLYHERHLWWFIVTLVPQIVSLIVVNGFSMKWYLHDLHEAKFLSQEISLVHWILRIFFHVTFLGPVIRYIELFMYGLHSLESHDPARESYKVLVLQEETDTSMLSLIGGFIKSAPQLVLQLYILLQKKRVHLSTAHAQEVSIVMSIITLSMSLTSYHRALRRSTPSKLNMTTFGTGLQFLSYVCIIGCRVLALASFASVQRHWLLVFIACHWFLMMSWLITKKTSFCSTHSGDRRTFEEFLFNVIMAVIYIFCFLNVKNEPTRWKYTFYYVLIWAQNITLTVLWYVNTSLELWIKLPLLLASFVGLFIGLSILGLYYMFFHPNKVSRVTTFVQVSF